MTDPLVPPPAASPQPPKPLDGLSSVGLDPRVKEAFREALALQERRVREQVAAEMRLETAKAVAKAVSDSSNGKPRIPAAWVPYLYVGLTVCGAITTALIGDPDVPSFVLKFAAVGTLTFGGLLAGSPGLRKGIK